VARQYGITVTSTDDFRYVGIDQYRRSSRRTYRRSSRRTYRKSPRKTCIKALDIEKLNDKGTTAYLTVKVVLNLKNKVTTGITQSE